VSSGAGPVRGSGEFFRLRADLGGRRGTLSVSDLPALAAVRGRGVCAARTLPDQAADLAATRWAGALSARDAPVLVSDVPGPPPQPLLVCRRSAGRSLLSRPGVDRGRVLAARRAPGRADGLGRGRDRSPCGSS